VCVCVLVIPVIFTFNSVSMYTGESYKENCKHPAVP